MSANVDLHCRSDANAKDIGRRSAPKHGLPVSTVRHGCGAHPRWSFRAPSSGLWTEYRRMLSAFRPFCSGSENASIDGNPAYATQQRFPASQSEAIWPSAARSGAAESRTAGRNGATVAAWFGASKQSTGVVRQRFQAPDRGEIERSFAAR